MSEGVIYVVDLEIEVDAADEFAVWLAEHVPEMLSIEGFESARWYRRERLGEPAPRVSWSVHYRVRDRAALAHYFEHEAQRMRGEGIARFAGRFTATRSVLTLYN